MVTCTNCDAKILISELYTTNFGSLWLANLMYGFIDLGVGLNSVMQYNLQYIIGKTIRYICKCGIHCYCTRWHQ